MGAALLVAEQYSELFFTVLKRAIEHRRTKMDKDRLRKEILDCVARIKKDSTVGQPTAMTAALPGSMFHKCNAQWGIVYKRDDAADGTALLQFQILHHYGL